MGTTRMPTPIRPKKANGREQSVYWIRKKLMMLALRGFERPCAWSEDEGVGHSRVNTPVPKLSPH
jgi:hypothetical protein